MKIFSVLFLLLGVLSFQKSVAQVAPYTEICLVTVDTALDHNVVVWERSSQISVYPIDSILVYRVTLGGSDSLIATVEYDSLSEYHDTAANPNLHAYGYRIAGKDVNGNIGPLSAPHSTIHFILVQNQAGEFWLKWTPYIGNTVDFYQCWDMTQTPSQPNLINTTSNGTDTSWNFTGAQFGGYDMKVDVGWSVGCTSSELKANHNTTRSNQASGSFVDIAAGIDNHGFENDIQEVIIAPNPMDESFKLTFSSLSWTPIDISIYDVNGRVVKTLSPVKVLGQYSLEIDMSDLDAGMYNLVMNNGRLYSRRIMKK